MKKQGLTIAFLLLFGILMSSATVRAQQSPAGRYSMNVENANGDMESHVLVLSETENGLTGEYIVASPDGMDQRKDALAQVHYNAQTGELRFVRQGKAVRAEIYLQSDGTASLLIDSPDANQKMVRY